LVVEKSGEHKNQLNLKMNGLTPLVDSIRTLALGQRIFETNTLDRISTLVEKEVFSQAEADDLRDAFNVIMLVRIRHHVSMISRGGERQLYQSCRAQHHSADHAREAFKATTRCSACSNCVMTLNN
jgi:CBS domain-containing protein